LVWSLDGVGGGLAVGGCDENLEAETVDLSTFGRREPTLAVTHATLPQTHITLDNPIQSNQIKSNQIKFICSNISQINIGNSKSIHEQGQQG